MMLLMKSITIHIYAPDGAITLKAINGHSIDDNGILAVRLRDGDASAHGDRIVTNLPYLIKEK
jgi:hypothetical protein